MGAFEMSLKNFEQSTIKKMDQAKRKIAFQLFVDIVKLTPVDTGRARGNWNIAAIPITSVEDFEGSPSGAASHATMKGMSILAKNTVGKPIFITNNVPYIWVLENGSSQQAPHGMVRTAVKRFTNVRFVGSM